MYTERIIPCPDVRDGRVVKGINPVGPEEVGDPVNLARAYYEQGADELVFLDITATREQRGAMVQVVECVTGEIFIPSTVGGGIRSAEDIRNMLLARADKVSLSSAAIRSKEPIREEAAMFGNQYIVLAVNRKRHEDGSDWNVYVASGREDTGLDLLEWVQEGVCLGVGEILLTSVDADETKQGSDIELCKAMHELVDAPVITSGDYGTLEHFAQVFEEDASDAALTASIFYYKEATIPEVKACVKEKGIAAQL